MKLTSPILTSAIRGLLVPAFSLSVCSVALGQNAPAQAPQQNTPAPQQQKKNNIAIQLGNVLVTGSHIPSSTVVTAQPITIISSKQIAATGLQTIGQLLQQMPAVSPTMNSTFNFESNGASNLDLRYLGANRILVLVNGQRWVTSIDGTTDLNSIPLSIVDHIEVLKAGASSIYGSDAISGVVNIVLIKNINGGKASAYYGIWHGDGHWDGQTQQYSFTVGANGDKSGWLFSGSYNRNLRIPGVDRTFSSEPVPGTGVSRGSSATPQGRFVFIAPTTDNPSSPSVTPAAYTGLTAQQCPATNFGTSAAPEYLPFCNLTIAPGTNGQSASDYVPFTTNDHYNWITPSGNSLGDSLLNPITTKSGYFTGHYDFTDAVRFTSSLAYSQLTSETDSAPNLLFFTNGTVAANQQYNPFGFAFSSNPVQVAPGVTRPTLLLIGRRLGEFPGRVRLYESDTYRFNGDFNGYLNIGSSYWTWDAGFLDMSLRNQETQTAGIIGPNFNLALGDATTCANTTGCVPLNLFGGYGPNGTGSITPAQVNYLYYPVTNLNGTNQRITHLDIANADLADLPAGPLGFAAGYQFSTINGYFTPDAIDQAGLGVGAAKAYPTNGGYNVTSLYTEFSVPILAKIPGVYNLNADLATRYSKYNTYGSTTRSTLGLKWQPVEDLAIRGDWAQGFRAPDINELYAGQNISFPTVFDPCSGYTSAGANPAAAKYCAAAGVPASYTQLNQQINTLQGGNPNLKPETSISKDFGFVYSPHQVPGLDLEANYYHIEIGNTIQTYGPNNILNACYLTGSPTYCSDVQRNSFGTVTQINNLETNVGTTLTDGIDFDVKYNNLATSFGNFAFDFTATHVRDFKEYLPNGLGGVNTVSLVGVERAGFTLPLSVPSWKAGFNINWQYDDWGVTWSMHYISSLMESCSDGYDNSPLSLANLGLCSQPNFTNNSLSMNRLAAVVWHDVQAVYHGPHNIDYTIGVNNIFDKKPPNETQPIEDMAFDPTEYEALLGTFIYGRIGVSF